MFESVGVIGPIAEFSFTAPELSEVFIASIANATPTPTLVASGAADTPGLATP